MANNIEIYYYIRDAVACLGVLVGVGGAIFLFVKKKTLPAILSLLGFFALGLEPLADLLIWRVLGNGASPNWETLNTAYACLTGPSLFIGVVLLVLAFVLAFREPKLPPPPLPDDLPPAI
jgi:hypothetical protein